MITKIRLKNYRVFKDFTLELTRGLNILVGDNDAGKSTLLEAIRLALTGRLGDRWLWNALSPHLFNQEAATKWVEAVRAGNMLPPPEMIIDLYLDSTDETAALKGTNNLELENEAGLRIRVAFNPAFAEEYEAFIDDPEAVTLVPIEYYQVDWLSFAGNAVTTRSVPAAVSKIDASAIKLHSGADYYLQQIIGDHLDPNERVELSRAYRSLREQFSQNPSITSINESLAEGQDDITDRELSLSIDISEKTAWESSLVPHLDALPFQFIGNGSQNQLKILLALKQRVADVHVVLIEEPENHLSPASLNTLVSRIAERCADKQVIVTTHSSFVVNKLGLDRLVLLGEGASMRLTDLPAATLDYFKKLSGYDTLRLVLAPRSILVEGPSDELTVLRAYRDEHDKAPLEDGVDVLNVRGLSFRRFLDIAKPLGKRVAVVTDNDGRTPEEVQSRFDDYTTDTKITVHTGLHADGRTLEPQMISKNGLDVLNELLGRSFETTEDLEAYMKGDKTGWALTVFEHQGEIKVPPYIADAIRP